MLLNTLKNRLAFMSNNALRQHAYLAYQDPKTGRTERLYLDVAYDLKGHICFIKSQQHGTLHAKWQAELDKKFKSR